ncbi:MAG: SH3 domain-containing protein [Alphaproteobacteria bacterium]|nr:SH3 domain-containing protein [Alphaproteobacteria bacterium]
MPARASLDSSVASRAIPIDLRPVISAYRKRGRFQLRVEKLPQSARFSAGQNNGDGSWSLLLDELEDLVYFAPKSVVGDHTLAIRLIAKDETEAFTIALIDYTVKGDVEGAATAQANAPLPDDVRNELHKLKALLEARDSELTQLRESAERMGVMLQQKLDMAVAEAQASWKREEAARMLAEKTRLEEQFGNRLEEREMRAQAMAEIASEQQASALRLMRQEFAATKDALAARDSELAASRAQMERVRKDWEADIASTKASLQAKAGETLKAAEAEWTSRLDKAEAERKAMEQAADAAAKLRKQGESELAALRGEMESLRARFEADGAAAKAVLESKVADAIKTAQAGARADHDGEIARLRAELERQHQQAQNELAAANAKAAERLKGAEAEWQARSDKALAELVTKQAAGASDLRAHHDNRLAELGAELERLKRQTQAEIAGARADAQAKAAERLKAAEAEWQARSDKALAELAAKHAAKQEVGATDLRAHRNSQVLELNAALERQQQQAKAEIAALQAGAEAGLAKALATAEAEWRTRSDDALAAMRERLEKADAALAAANAAPAGGEEIQRLQDQLERLRNWSDAEIAAAKVAAEARAAQLVKDSETEWRARSDATLALVTARCVAAEAALAAADKSAPLAERDAEIAHLRDEIARQARMAEADMAAAKAAADIAAGEKLKAGQAIWEQETAGALAKANARAEAAETALDVERRSAEGRLREDEYVHSLEREIKTLRATLVDREAALVQTQATQEQIRLGTVREGPGARWQPLPSGRQMDDGQGDGRAVGEEPRRSAKDNANMRLLRDAGVVVMAAAAAVLLLPKLEAMLPNNVRWQIETMGGMFLPSDTPAAPTVPAVAAATQPKVEHPLKYATRSINVRTQPSTGGAIAINLKRGASVAVLETQGSWDRVEVSTPQGPAVQGWVFNTYLSDAAEPAAASRPVPKAAPETSVPAQAAPVAATAEPPADAAPTP